MENWEPVSYDGNVQKFLDFLGKAEGADYNTIVGGKTFDDYSAHPNVVGLRTKDGPSTASGKYQITNSTYQDVAPKLGISDFSPASQDRIAVELIKRNGALDDVQSGNFDAAINKLGGTWASLPSSQYNQPKRSKEWVSQQLAYSDGGWEPATTATDAGKSGGWTPAADGWEPVSKATPAKLPDIAVPASKTQPAPTPSPAPAATTKPNDKSILRSVDDFVRGAADTLTFGYADEIAAKLDKLTGLNTANPDKPLVRQPTKLSDLVLNKNPNSEDAILAEQRARDAEGGGARLAGQVAGALVPTVGVVRAADTAGKLGRIGAGAATGLIQSGLYGSGSATGDINSRIEGAVDAAPWGALGGGIVGGVLPATLAQKGSEFIRKAGTEEGARLDAEIIRDLQAASENPNLKGNTLKPFQVNALEQKYVADANNAVKALGKDGLDKLGVNKTDLQAAIQSRRILTPDELSYIRGNPAGDALADAIEKAQRARALTEQVSANPSMLAKLTRMSIDAVPTAIGASVGGVPGAMIGGMATPLADKFAQRLTGKASREEVVQQLIKNPDVAENVLSRLGPSQATQSLDNLQQMAQRAQASKQAQLAQQQAQQAAALAQQAANKNQILQQTRMPAGGGFQELMNGGRSGLNMSSGDAIDALRTVSKAAKGTPVGDAAKQMLQSKPVTDEQAFYGVQNMIRRLSEEGKVTGGVTTIPQGALSSGIRNPVSYEANVKNATEALKIAREAAPTPELAQFASSIGRIKGKADKATAIEARLAKASDPTEVDYLTKLVKPLANFGKK